MPDTHDRYVLDLRVTHETPPPTDGHSIAGIDDVLSLTAHLDRDALSGETGARARRILEHAGVILEAVLDARDAAILDDEIDAEDDEDPTDA